MKLKRRILAVLLTLAVMAALKIAEKWPAVRENADTVIHQVTDREDFSIHSTLKGRDQVPYQMASMIREAVRITESRRVIHDKRRQTEGRI